MHMCENDNYPARSRAIIVFPKSRERMQTNRFRFARDSLARYVKTRRRCCCIYTYMLLYTRIILYERREVKFRFEGEDDTHTETFVHIKLVLYYTYIAGVLKTRMQIVGFECMCVVYECDSATAILRARRFLPTNIDDERREY